MRILVLRGGALGDFIVTLPALALLRTRWPDARIELAGNTAAAELGIRSGLLDAAHSQHEQRWAGLYTVAVPANDFDCWLRSFELVISFWPDPDGELARHFPRHPGQQFLSAPAVPVTAPAAAHFCAALHPLGLSASSHHHRLPWPAALRTHGPAGSVALHPGSGSPRKNWPLERWEELGRWISRDLRRSVTVISGEAEKPEILAGIGTPMRSRPLAELASALAGSGLFVGHDSGVSHLAAAVGAPSVLLFGPTDAKMWAPPAPCIHVLQRGSDLASLSFSEVQQAVASALSDRS